MFQDSVNKKMYAIDRDGQYLFDFVMQNRVYVRVYDKCEVSH